MLGKLSWLIAVAFMGGVLLAGTEVRASEDDMETDSGRAPYAQWENGPPADPDWFPIAVYLQGPANASRYRDVGVNVYIGLWKGPTEEQLAELRKHDMLLICEQNEVGMEHLDDPLIIGWMQMDEPDNAQRMGAYWKSVEQIKEAWPNAPADGLPEWHSRTMEDWGEWGPCESPKTIIERYEEMKANDPTRPVYLGLGMGVAYDGWQGRRRANHPEDYAIYMRGADIAGFDIYPMATLYEAVRDQIWRVPFGVQRLVKWSHGNNIIWNSLECSQISREGRGPTPQQTRAEVWMSLIHGSTGIIYFSHVMESSRFSETGLLDDPDMAATVKDTNEQIHRLARVLNSPTLCEALAVEADPARVPPEEAATVGTGPVPAMAKRHDGDVYVFAVNMQSWPVSAEFTVKDLDGKADAEVVDENRTLPVEDGSFADEFAPYEVHIYRIEG